MTAPLAHAGHWLVNLAYLAPLLFLGVVVLRGRLKDRRERSSLPPTESRR